MAQGGEGHTGRRAACYTGVHPYGGVEGSYNRYKGPSLFVRIAALNHSGAAPSPQEPTFFGEFTIFALLYQQVEPPRATAKNSQPHSHSLELSFASC